MKTNQQPQQPQTTTPIQTKQLPKTGNEKPAWVNPAIKIAAVGVGTVAILFAAGGLFRVLAWTMRVDNDKLKADLENAKEAQQPTENNTKEAPVKPTQQILKKLNSLT